jgi:hypothetical protein
MPATEVLRHLGEPSTRSVRREHAESIALVDGKVARKDAAGQTWSYSLPLAWAIADVHFDGDGRVSRKEIDW